MTSSPPPTRRTMASSERSPRLVEAGGATRVPTRGESALARRRASSLWARGPEVTPSGQIEEDRVVVIGSGWLFASGISHYTYRLSSALAE